MSGPRVVLAVDGNSLVHRAYHAAAGSAGALRAEAGTPVWAVRGLVTQIVTAVERVGADVVVVGFDDPVVSERRARWPQYKVHRSEKSPCLVDQLALAVVLLRELGLVVVVPEGLEADDVLASTAACAAAAGAQTIIMTSDRDAFALIDETTSVLRIINGGVEASPLLTPRRFPALLGIAPQQYRDFAALRGDPSDNLIGVRGIGPKTATKLLCALGSVREAFADLDDGGARVVAAIGSAAARRLAAPDARAAWELNCAVMAMRTDVKLGVDLGSGAGMLPVSCDAIRRVYATLGLIYSLPAALRILGGAEDGDTVARQPETYDEIDLTGPAPARPQRFPRLPRPPEPAHAQLALFA